MHGFFFPRKAVAKAINSDFFFLMNHGLYDHLRELSSEVLVPEIHLILLNTVLLRRHDNVPIDFLEQVVEFFYLF